MGISAAEPVFPSIRRQPKLADQVVEAVEGQIARGALTPGEKLPPERALCEQFGVSRTAVREAVRSLEAKGLLEVRAGGGTWVRAPSAAPASQLLGLAMQVQATGGGQALGVTWANVLEARRVLEVELAALAATRRTADDLRALSEALDAMHSHRSDPEGWSRADVQFHAALAAATGNPLMPLLLGAMQDVLLDARRQAHRLRNTPAKALAHHRAIYDAVAAQDAPAARDAMRAHLDESETTLTTARERAR